MKTSVRLQIDQTMRTRNFSVRNEVEEQSPRVEKGKKAYVDRKVGECFQWKTNGQCSKGDSCSFSHDQPLETVAELRDEKDNRPLPHQIRRPRLTAKEQNPQKIQAT